MSKGCGCCVDTRKFRKDFRASKGDGPEVAKHKKKGGKKRVRHASDHKHIYIWQKAVDYYWWTDSRYVTWEKICCEWGCGKVNNIYFDWTGGNNPPC